MQICFNPLSSRWSDSHRKRDLQFVAKLVSIRFHRGGLTHAATGPSNTCAESFNPLSSRWSDSHYSEDELQNKFQSAFIAVV